MDAFWLIPAALIAFAGFCCFVAMIGRHSSPPGAPRVLFHKDSETQPIDPAQHQAWTERPCGAFLDWITHEK